MHLRPLLDADVLQITRALAGGALPAELEARILAKAEGSPFFAEEITRSLIEEGYLAHGRTAASRLTRPVDEILIPGHGARGDRGAPRSARRPPPSGSRRWPRCSAGSFGAPQLVQLLAGEQVDVEHELAELTRRGVIHRKSLFSDDEYRFGESLTQEVAYEVAAASGSGASCTGASRRCSRPAAAIPALARPALLAHHFARSDDRAQRGRDAAAAPAPRPSSMPSYRTALDLYRQAWEIGEALLRDAPARSACSAG